LAIFLKYRKWYVGNGFQIDPETSKGHISGTVRYIATKPQTDVRCVTVCLPADFGVDWFESFFGEFLTGFRDFFNANNSETAEASSLELRLLCGSSRRYEGAKSELSRSNGKKSISELSTPTVSRGMRMGRPNDDQSIVLDEGVIVTQFGDVNCRG
jgi:hypothetical protein